MGFLRYAVTASAILLGCQPALALPQANEVVPLPVSAWVLVDEAGSAVTMSPVVSTNNGAATTINPPPSTLMATGTYTLLPSGVATTKTGLAPVATATGKNDAGIFLACTRYQGPGGPFCQPEPGTVLYVGHTYYGKHSTCEHPATT
ncbi:hypothetical protein B0T16DRAFT_201157 [Cercophora newfieldiana]|uniref:Uncharacterized protein n=1 Tax=Cercophora newfieldiana TaxID=92897 RepID=A0AA40CJH1_9PEZI|nr:hypothetical protein B0T16DRAFT_201157 [Cercophora newfieldiana]